MGKIQNHAGQPPRFRSKKELEEKIQEYFQEECGPEFKVVDGSDEPQFIGFKRPTITGLAYFLGFVSRQSIYDYEKDGRYSYTIKRARLYIEATYEQALQNPNIKPSGPIFALKNLGWADQQKIEHTGEMKHSHTISPRIAEILDELDDDEDVDD